MAHADAQAEPASARRIAIVAGGTAGHVYPALAVANAYRAALADVELLFLGNSAGFEAELVGRSGYRFQSISASPLVGQNLRGKARAMGNLVSSCIQARRILKAGGFQMMLGFGSYTCGGAILAARSLGIKTALHEANTRVGVANRFLGSIVDRAYIGFETTARDFPSGKAHLTGNPVRSEVLALLHEPRKAPDGSRAVRILVTGGSLGSAFLNLNVPEMIGLLGASGFRVEVRHLIGRGRREDVPALYRRAQVEAVVSEYVEDTTPIYRWADFAITCAGAATMAELAIAGLPALFVPLRGAARNHQFDNAIAFTNEGGGWYVEEHRWSPEALADRIASLLSDAEAWRAASSAMRRMARPSAADLIVADCEALVGGNGAMPSNGAEEPDALRLAGR